MTRTSGHLSGHALLHEGAAYNDRGTRLWRDTGGRGRARCSCGEMSEPLDSGNLRKKWHRAHKDAIRGEQR